MGGGENRFGGGGEEGGGERLEEVKGGHVYSGRPKELITRVSVGGCQVRGARNKISIRG